MRVMLLDYLMNVLLGGSAMPAMPMHTAMTHEPETEGTYVTRYEPSRRSSTLLTGLHGPRKETSTCGRRSP